MSGRRSASFAHATGSASQTHESQLTVIRLMLADRSVRKSRCTEKNYRCRAGSASEAAGALAERCLENLTPANSLRTSADRAAVDEHGTLLARISRCRDFGAYCFFPANYCSRLAMLNTTFTQSVSEPTSSEPSPRREQ